MNPLNSIEKDLSNDLTARENDILNLFNDASSLDWEDWRWQIRNRFQTKEDLQRWIKLTPHEEQGIDKSGDKLTTSIPPYFAALIDQNNPKCPIRLQSIPRIQELITTDEEYADPCAEDQHSPVHGLVHRYPDRVLFLVNEMCAMYCRYCTRSRMVGDGNRTLSTDTYNEALEYIRNHPEVRDVLISGGDPLTLSDRVLEYIIRRLKEIPHVEFVRIGSRVPVTLPQRITPDLIAMLKKYSPLWMSIHFNHPKEITPQVSAACNMIADAGIPMGSQTVLLKDVNDNPEIMMQLMHDLLKIRVRPYYIYQCDPIQGSKHFRTPISTGIKIIEALRGHTTGYAVPTFVVDAPGGGGKIPVGPDYVVSKDGKKYTLRNFSGQEYHYYE